MRRLVAVALGAAFAVTGCSVEAPEEPESRQPPASGASAATPDLPPPRYIPDATVRTLPADSPQRAVLQFWQDVQYKNLLPAYDALARGFKREFGRSLAHFTKYLAVDFQHWLTIPTILFARQSGKVATVAISYPRRGPPSGDRATVTLRREGGRWRIAYMFYLANRLNGQ